MNARFVSFVLAVTTTAIASCSSNDPGSTTEAAAVTVAVTNYKFTPPNVTVKVGQIVEWQFQQGVHDVTAGTNSGGTGTTPTTCTPDGKFASGEPQASGTYRFKFTAAGTFPYFCTPHCDLKQFGTVTVTP